MTDIEAPGASRDDLVSAHAPPIGLVGYGLLGEALALRLSQAGLPVLAHDTDAGRQARAAAAGVAVADGLADLAARCSCILLAVYDASQVGALLETFATATPAPRQVLLCTTTLSPLEAEQLCHRAQTLALHFVEMPVSGSSRELCLGRALALLGGDEALPAESLEAVRAACPQYLQVGGRGRAARLKHVINLVLELNRAALAEGLILAEAYGLDLAQAESALLGSAAASRVMTLKTAKMRRADFTPEGRLEQSLKDLRAMLTMGVRAQLPLTSMLESVLTAAARAGDGHLDSSAVIRELRRRGQSARHEVLPW